MGDLRVSYAALEDVRGAMESARTKFAGSATPTDGGSFGADDVAQAFSTFRTTQERAGEWLVDTTRTLEEYAHDTRLLVENADRDLAGKAEGKR